MTQVLYALTNPSRFCMETSSSKWKYWSTEFVDVWQAFDRLHWTSLQSTAKSLTPAIWSTLILTTEHMILHLVMRPANTSSLKVNCALYFRFFLRRIFYSVVHSREGFLESLQEVHFFFNNIHFKSKPGSRQEGSKRISKNPRTSLSHYIGRLYSLCIH